MDQQQMPVKLPKSTKRALRALLARYEAADDYNRPAIAWTMKRFFMGVQGKPVQP